MEQKGPSKAPEIKDRAKEEKEVPATVDKQVEDARKKADAMVDAAMKPTDRPDPKLAHDPSKLIREGHADYVAANLDKYPKVDAKKLAKGLMESGADGIAVLLQNLPKFKGLKEGELVDQVISKKAEHLLGPNLDKFAKLGAKEIAFKILDNGNFRVVTRQLDRQKGQFKTLDPNEVAMHLIDSGKMTQFATYVSDFPLASLNRKVYYRIYAEGAEKAMIDNNIGYLNVFTGLPKGEYSFNQ